MTVIANASLGTRTCLPSLLSQSRTARAIVAIRRPSSLRRFLRVRKRTVWLWRIPFSNRSRATALVWAVSTAFG
jgi:hypothetical protein